MQESSCQAQSPFLVLHLAGRRIWKNFLDRAWQRRM